MNSFFNYVALGMALCLRSCGVAASEDLAPITPPNDAVFSSSRQINALQIAPDGALWAATSGGILRRETNGAWTKWTRQNGLPSHEAQRVSFEKNQIRVQFPTNDALFDSEKWRVTERAAPRTPASTCSVVWHGATWTANLNGLTRRDDKTARVIALPPSNGTHISALLVREDALWAALFGDGLWRFDGKTWSRLNLQIPNTARDITSLAGDAQNVWLGTRRAGVWRYEFAAKRWGNLVQDEPFDGNVQNIVAFGGALWFSTLEDGIVARTPNGWRHYASELSSNAPRQLVTFRNTLYIRHGGGEVDAFDGKAWRKNVFPNLPRGKVLAMCADESRLYLGQWGGWSEWDGQRFAHFLRFDELQGLPPLTLLANSETLWFGTQSRGLIEARREVAGAHTAPIIGEIAQSLSPTLPQISYQLKVWDERQKLPDDWITALAGDAQNLAVGTFVGGAAWRIGENWQTAPELNGANVTSLARDNDAWWIATRRGLFRRDALGKVTNCSAKLPWLDSELQALFLTPQGLWIGARTGITFVSRATLDGLESGEK